MSPKDQIRARVRTIFNPPTTEEGEKIMGALIYRNQSLTGWRAWKVLPGRGDAWTQPAATLEAQWKLFSKVGMEHPNPVAEVLRIIQLPDRAASARRKFTDEFTLGDYVSITRTKHGWHDGNTAGWITELTEHTCLVKDDDKGYLWEIVHPRDICKERWRP